MLHGFLFINMRGKQSLIKDPSCLDKGHFPSLVLLWYRHGVDVLSHR